ncbi:MAG TPA: hypothetical protein VF721_07465 [Pyrinomonadaceae bacterium]|jgi:hypothetical protein
MWFEIAITAILLLVGQILFGHFEERTPRWRILGKHALGIIIYTSIAYFFGGFWFYLSMAATLAALLIVHGWWLPKHGINGWTGEPKEKYYALRGWKL